MKDWSRWLAAKEFLGLTQGRGVMAKQFGNSVLEVLLIITVSMLMVVLAIRYFTVVDFNRRVAQVLSQIDTISKASYQWLDRSGSENFRMIALNKLVQGGYISQADVKSPWGAIFSVKPASDGQHVTIMIDHLPKAACLHLRKYLSDVAYTEVMQTACQRGVYSGEF